MKTLTYKNYTGSIDADLDSNMLHGKILCINDLVTYVAPDLKSLKIEFESAVDDYVETCKQVGKPAEKPFNGLFQVRIKPELHRLAALRSVHDAVKLNAVVVTALETYLTPGKPVVHTHNHDHKITVNSVQTIRSSSVSAGQGWTELNLEEGVRNGNSVH